MEGIILNDRYELTGLAGQGGMGTVYRAYDTALKRQVAVKVLNAHGLDRVGQKRLLHEARTAAQLDHPNVVTIYDVGQTEGTPYLVMQLVEGATLYDKQPETLQEVLAVAQQICAALVHAHTQGIIHRDLKPENVIVSPDGAARLMDFGLARSLSRLSVEDGLVGTVAYMAPELALGQSADARADLYSLGVLLYELVTGELPFQADDPFALITQHIHAPVVPPRAKNETIPAALNQLVLALLAKQPAKRPESAAEVKAKLDTISQVLETEIDTSAHKGLEVPQPPHPPPLPPERPSTPTGVLERIVRGQLIGRKAELALLRDSWRKVLAGSGQVVLLSGEPGIGKTRLVRELTTQVQVQGSQTLTGASYPEGEIPYGPFIEIIETVFANSHDDGLGLSNLKLAELIRMAPNLQDRFSTIPPNPELDLKAAQYRMFDALLSLTKGLSKHSALLLVLEDLHWADNGTLALLQHLARRTRDLPILILATYRDTALTTSLQDTLGTLNRERLAIPLKLSRLDRNGTEDLLNALFAETTTPEFLDGIYHETEGTPFFIEEVCKSLVENGQIYFENGHWHWPKNKAGLAIPQSVQVAVQNRVKRLPDEVQSTLTAAGIFGRTFDFETLLGISDIDEDGVIEALERAESAQLIEEISEARGGTFRFTHALIPGTLVENLSGLRRRRLHGKAAEVIVETRPKEIATIAHHYWRARNTEGLPYLQQAGELAEARYANDEAVAWYTRALELALDESLETRWELLLAREKLANIMGDREAQKIDLQNLEAAANNLNDAGKQAEASLSWARYYSLGISDHSRAIPAAKQAIAYAKDAADRKQEADGYLNWGRALSYLRKHKEAQEQLQRALAFAREENLPQVIGNVSVILGSRAMMDGDLLDAHDYYQQTLAAARAAGDRALEIQALERLGSVYKYQGDFPKSLSARRDALEIAREIGNKPLEAGILESLGRFLVEQGEYREGETYLRKSLELAREVGDRHRVMYSLLGISEVSIIQEDYLSAWDFTEQALEIARAVGDPDIENLLYRQFGNIAIHQGDYTKAQQFLERALPVSRKANCMPCTIENLRILGFIAETLGDLNAGRSYQEQALALARETELQGSEANVLRGMGSTLIGLGEHDQGIEAFQEAHLLQDKMRLHIREYESMSDMAQVALAQDDLENAQEKVHWILDHLDERNLLEATEAPLRIALLCIQALQANGDPRANEILKPAYRLLQEQATKIPDEDIRRSFLENVPWHREIVALWEARQEK